MAYHPGEVALQERTGSQELAARHAGIVRGAIDRKVLPFLSQRPFIVLGSLDASGQPWASVLFGPPGFVRSADGASVVLELEGVSRGEADALWSNVVAGRELAILAIDLESRRRFRINGVLDDVVERRALLRVREAYMNCPKYIQRRELVAMTANEPSSEVASGATLDGVRAPIESADTFFLASRHPESGPDVSHRGGPPGFVRVLDDRTLRVPDYAGNGMFNTLGNFAIDDRAGVTFLDFASARVLQLSGRVRILHDQPEAGQPTGGTGRFWELSVDAWRAFSLGVELQVGPAEASPFNPE
jgi:predicted pyridoxine 5'-phosphate oxidase superfamily flavin-nucleotide-binding protein